MDRTFGLTNQQLGELKKVILGVNSHFEKCSMPGCLKPSARNHILQENGILNLIADTNGKVYQIENGDAHFKDAFHFREHSIAGGKVLTFPSLCSAHDDNFFHPIEKKQPDLTDHKQLVLFSYRAALNKKYDILKSIQVGDALQISTLPSHVKKIHATKSALFRNILPDVDHYISLLENEINDPVSKQHFMFAVVPLFNLNTAASFAFSEIGLPLQLGAEDLQCRNYKKAGFKPIHHMKFVHIIPQPKETFIVIGVPLSEDNNVMSIEGFLFEKFGNANAATMTAFLTDALTRFGSSWCISKHLYSKLRAVGMDKKIEKQINSFPAPGSRASFNMFSVLP